MKVFPSTVATLQEDEKRAEIQTNRGDEFRVETEELFHTYAPHKGRFHDEWTYSGAKVFPSKEEALQYAVNVLDAPKV